jgi:phospholipid-binding lipoprotein MlaA
MQLRAKQLGQPDPTQPADNLNLDELIDAPAPAGKSDSSAPAASHQDGIPALPASAAQ